MDCGLIDDDTIELYVMGRMDDPVIREHLDTCEGCQARVIEAREYIQDMRRGLEEFRKQRNKTS